MRLLASAVVVTASLGALLVGAVGSAPANASPPDRLASAAAPPSPSVRVETLVTGLSIPWDLAFLPDGSFLFDQRGGITSLRNAQGVVRVVRTDQSDLVTGGEPGLLGLVVDPDFATNRLYYTCQTHLGSAGEANDVRVIRWQLAVDRTSAARVGRPLVTGIPLGSFHAGCRLRFDSTGLLQVGTGDAGVGTNPQDLTSLGGKTLRVSKDGSIPADNPFRARGGNAAYIYTYGHRNVQGLALQPGTGRMWSAEHGPDRDDEINRLVAGGNYGWNPVPGYNQTVPMTDLTLFPHAKVAKWSSGFPTLATSGATFLRGKAWGPWEGALAVGLLKDSGVLLLKIGPQGQVTATSQLAAVDNTFGRIRTAQFGPGGTLYLTTSNDGGTDVILKVTPL
ncbi:MAG: PQQ-dependent sugar dehydrogenase [Lapillicoccus sp.]